MFHYLKKPICMALAFIVTGCALGFVNVLPIEKAVAASSFDADQVIWFDTIPENDSTTKKYLASKGKVYNDDNSPAPLYVIDPNNKGDANDYGNVTDSLEKEKVSSRILSRIMSYNALPIGNGRLGGMIYGGIEKEIVQINEDTFYSLQPAENQYILDPTNPSSSGSYQGASAKKDSYKAIYDAATDALKAKLPSPEPKDLATAWEAITSWTLNMNQLDYPVRQAMEEYINCYFTGDPYKQAGYQSFVELYLNFGQSTDKVKNYTRSLDLSNATVNVEYDYDNVHYTRKNLASYDKQSIVTHLTASGDGNLNIEAEMHSWQHSDVTFEKIADDQISIKGKGRKSDLMFEARLIIDTDGELEVISVTDSPTQTSTSGTTTTYTYPDEGSLNTIKVTGANYATCYVVGATSYQNYKTVIKNDTETPKNRCNNYVAGLSGATYAEIEETHLADYQQFYNRSNIKLGGGIKESTTPTGGRFKNFGSSKDQSLVNLYYNFAKYLMISGSREGTQPLNLQGIWNASNMPAWDSKYTININTEMNYWMAQTANLSEFEKPLLEALLELEDNGEAVAKAYYGIDDAFVTHHNFDVWRGTSIVDKSSTGLWPVGGAWLLYHAWEYYQYTHDAEYLAKFYPLMKKSLTFFDGLLVEDSKTGYLISPASLSPEQGGVQPGPTMDHQLIRALYDISIKTESALKNEGLISGEDAATLASWTDTMSKVAPNEVNSSGYIKEWARDDVKYAANGTSGVSVAHKHTSHLWDIYPGNAVDPYATMTASEKKVYDGFKSSLTRRSGKDGTGWSIAWRINLWARMGDASSVYQMLQYLFTDGTYNNGFDRHPPFQIDGNFGGASGIQECLIQSYADTINILPTLPSQWKNGEFNNLKARGNYEVSAKWESGTPTNISVHSIDGGQVKLRNKNFSDILVLDDSNSLVPYTLQTNGTVVVFDTEVGRTYNLYNSSTVTIESWKKSPSVNSGDIGFLPNSSSQSPKFSGTTHMGYFYNDTTEIGFSLSNCTMKNLDKLKITLGVYVPIEDCSDLYVRIGGREGTEIGHLKLSPTEGHNNYMTFDIPLNENAPTSGNHTLYFLFKADTNTDAKYICNVQSVEGIISNAVTSSEFVDITLNDIKYSMSSLINGTYCVTIKDSVFTDNPAPKLIFAYYTDGIATDVEIIDASLGNQSFDYVVTDVGDTDELGIYLWTDLDELIPIMPALSLKALK